MSTNARIRSQKIGDTSMDVAEHKHDGFGWHWASAGHRDDGKIHKDADADKPIWPEGFEPTAAQRKLYTDSLGRVVVNKIPSKAKPKTEGESEKAEGKSDGASKPSNSGTAREKATAGA